MSTPEAGTVPELFRALCDDAALFPPGSAAMADAVPGHRAYREAWYAPLVGPFVVGAARVGELADTAGEPGEPLAVVPVLPGGAAGVADAVAAVRAAPGLDLAGAEVAVGDGTVADVLAALDAHLPPGVPAAVEVPRGEGREAALDALAGTGRRAKFRTGGVAAEAFPGEDELARAIAGCRDRDLAFKCTAGLHNAVRHRDPATGFEHHGFLNVLAATAAAERGAGPADLAAILAERSGEALAGALRALTPEETARTRRRFVSYGTCSVLEPLEDLIGLGLVRAPGTPA